LGTTASFCWRVTSAARDLRAVIKALVPLYAFMFRPRHNALLNEIRFGDAGAQLVS
jgi:hypothetical protein